MARHPRNVDEAIARFDDLVTRLDGKPAGRGTAVRTNYRRTARQAGRRLVNVAMAFAAVAIAAVAYGLFIAPIGWAGLFIAAMAFMCLLVYFGSRPTEPKRVEYSEELPTRTVVQQLERMLGDHRSALPAPAARRIDAIGQQLPLLEHKLAELDPLDPLAQDARRLMGKHLPELIDRYERVPAQYRSEREGDGMSVDERLVAGLDAARTALDEIGAKLSKHDIDAFETQGRFLESRYKDGSVAEGS